MTLRMAPGVSYIIYGGRNMVSRYPRRHSLKLIEVSLMIVVAITLIAFVVGYVVDRPVIVSYASSESMTPAIKRGDLFLINPLSKGGSKGDIIVFKNGNGWTVHRIYAVTDGGYITKGDANVATDQSNGAGLVRREDVAGEVVSVGGRVLKLPGFGEYLANLGGWRTPLLAVLVFMGAFLTLWDGERNTMRNSRVSRRSKGTKGPRRSMRRTFIIPLRSLYWPIALVLVMVFMLAMTASWGTFSFSYSSTMAGGQRNGWHVPGSMFNETVRVENRAFYPFYYIGEGGSNDVMSVEPRVLEVGGRSTGTFNVVIKTPEKRKIYTGKVALHAYPAFVPVSVLMGLYYVSPYLPLVLYATAMLLFLFVMYMALGLRNVTIRVRVRKGSLTGRIMSFVGF